MNARATSVPELISVASSIRVKRPNHQSFNQPPPKRLKYIIDNRNSPLFCSFCKRQGHSLRDCRSKNNAHINPEKPMHDKPSSTTVTLLSKQGDSRVCSFCSKPGHTFDTCFRREKEITSNINSVVRNNQSLNTMRMQVGNKIINTVFDSGAECSVMSESIAMNLPGRRKQIINCLRGIGPFPVVSTSMLKTICIIDNINVEIEFYILPDYEMTSGVLIGANLLRGTGLTVIVTQDRATLCSQPRVMHVRSSVGLFENINHDLNNTIEIEQLLSLLNKYSGIFTRGFSQCRDFSAGLKYLEQIFVSLREVGFSINIDKCLFFKQSIEYLGNVVENGQVHPSPKKVEALLKAPVPTNIKQVRQFNGLAGYFRRFIPDFARTMVPLYELTKQGTKWQWIHIHEQARQTIVRPLTSTPVLTIFQEGKPIELFTDASSLGFSAILVQIINDRQHVVAYFSMRTTDIESRYHSYELETLAVVRAIKHYRHFLYGRQFKVITDCNALKASKHKKDLLPRIHRWWSYLQNFEFDIEYRKGERIQLAFNCTVHRTTGAAPLSFLTRRQNCVPPELLNLLNLDDALIDIESLERHVQQKMTQISIRDKARFDGGRAKIQQFQKGDLVLLKNNPRNQTSPDPKFSDPYEVYRVLEIDRYLVKKVIGHRGRPRTVAHDQLRRAPQPGGATQAAVSPLDDEQAGPSGVAVVSQQSSISGASQPGEETKQ